MPCYLPLLHKFSPSASIIPFLLLSFTFTHLPFPLHTPIEKEMTLDNIPMGGGFFLYINTVIYYYKAGKLQSGRQLSHLHEVQLLQLQHGEGPTLAVQVVLEPSHLLVCFSQLALQFIL